MNVALFIPCYIDQLFPGAAKATLELLEELGVTVEVPLGQACCGQPMVNAGAVDAAHDLMKGFHSTFREFEYVVCPSASCVSMVRHHFPVELRPAGQVLELCEFLHDVLKVTSFPRTFSGRVALHQGCHGLRELNLGKCSELGNGVTRPNKVEALLRAVPDLQLVSPVRTDECCGFGGTFAVMEPEVSAAMGRSRIADFLQAGAEVIASTDMSCLMHLDGLIRRQKLPVRIAHIAEILRGDPQ